MFSEGIGVNAAGKLGRRSVSDRFSVNNEGDEGFQFSLAFEWW
jgi:hypothetical protein